MSRLARACARLLLPAGRRDWAEALWAEADAVPPGWRRLAWRAGGARLIAREARLGRKAGLLLLAAAAAWAAWPASAVPLSHGAVNEGDVVITLALLAGLPALSGRLLGPPGSRAARWVRAGFCAAILAIMPAKAAVEMFVGAVPRGGINRRTFDFITEGAPAPGSASGGPDWGGELFVLFITACYLAVIVALTARRAGVAPATLSVSARAGLLLGLVTYAMDPLGGAKVATNPWLPGAASDPLVALTWVLLFGAPLAAGAVAARRCPVFASPVFASPVFASPVPADRVTAQADRGWQGLAAGLVCGGAGAVTAAVLGTGTTALMLKSAWLRGLLYHGQHLTASALYGRELYASMGLTFYGAVCIAFPLVAAAMGLTGAALGILAGVPRRRAPAEPVP